MKRLIIILLCSLSISAFADWQTHFAYTNVTQIALGKDRVFGLSDGALFSVDKQSEKITEWTKMRGMHGAGIWQIGYDATNDMLLVVYGTGRIDLIKGNTVTYLSDFYHKDMTASKRTNNISFHNGRAYLSMEFGIVSFDMRKHEFVDTYYIGKEAAEVKVEDVVFKGDSIYAFTEKLLYSAALKDNVVDFRCWKSEALSNRIPRDSNKGKQYTDTNKDVWSAGGQEGIVRKTQTGERLSYLPKAPLTNIPYRLYCQNDRLYMLSGGRWSSQYMRPGHVMILQNGQWKNIPQSSIVAKTGKPALDFMNVAVDPKDPEHFYVTSYGTGVYEFKGTELVTHYTTENSSITCASDNKDHYTRCDGATFDKDGNLLLLSTSSLGPTIPILTKKGKWTGINLYLDGQQTQVITPGELLIDRDKPNYKWIPYCRSLPGLILLDDNGTLTKESDDRAIKRSEWTAQDGETVTPGKFYCIFQTANGDKWVGSDKGVIIIEKNTDFFTSDACRRLRIKMNDDTWLMENDIINAICADVEGNIWVGTDGHGVYVLSPDGNTIIQHYTSENTIMPGDAIMALACNTSNNRMYIGTDQGLVSYSDRETALETCNCDTDQEVDYGAMQGWTMHPSYTKITSITASADDIYALSDGALFSVDRKDESMTYYSKLTGLSSANIRFISYNKTVNKLLVIYQNSMMDLLNKNGITALSDVYLKAENKEMTINSIASDKQFVYLAMSFGILVLDMRKGEIADTYYIGNEATDIEVASIAISRDTLYAAAEGNLYVGALGNNLLDYAQWDVTPLPDSLESTLAAAGGAVYLLQDSVLFRYTANAWKQVTDERLIWVKPSGNKLLAYTATKGLAEIQSDGKITTLTTDYVVSDALFDNGEYWLAANTAGLLRYKDKSYQAFQPNGPYNNFSYRLQFAGDRLFVAPGGRWSSQYFREGDVMYYDYTAKQWHNIPYLQMFYRHWHIFLDIMNYAVDPANPNHFFVTSYGNGMAEYLNDDAIAYYNEHNSTLRSNLPLTEDSLPSFLRTDGALFDKDGNLWVLNAGKRGSAVNIRSPQGTWYALPVYQNGQKLTLTTPSYMIADNHYPNSKWFADCRDVGLIVLDDGGTPFDPTDDHVLKRSEFYDQLGTRVAPANIYSLAQDKDGILWVGTDAGPLLIKSVNDFLQSAACERPIIHRNDGTGLVDYLLHAEQINTICVDGGNRKWIGTENSGVFLMSADGTETIYHFTSKNSPLPSDNILSIAIHPTSGEVFFGTGSGLVSFRSDASDPAENYDGIYAFPNPVRPNFEGVITISGLMDNTVVTIIDSGGNLVCKTKSNGGIAIWDGKNFRGERVTTGVYTVLCNTADGASHAVTKILVTH